MDRRHHLVAVAALCGLAIAHFASRSLSRSAPAPGTVSEHEPAQISAAAREREALAYEQQTRARVSELEKAATEKRLRDQAAQKTHEAREQLALKSSSSWAAVIRTNWPTFQTLREKAAHSPDKKVPCTICNAKGVLDFCVACGHTGKCPACGGTGKVHGDICPACLGSGKCFLCFGTGKMPCPFCQSLPDIKEVITPKTPNPPPEIPVY